MRAQAVDERGQLHVAATLDVEVNYKLESGRGYRTGDGDECGPRTSIEDCSPKGTRRAGAAKEEVPQRVGKRVGLCVRRKRDGSPCAT